MSNRSQLAQLGCAITFALLILVLPILKFIFWDGGCDDRVYRVAANDRVAFYKGFDGWERDLLYRGDFSGRVWEPVDQFPRKIADQFAKPILDYPTDPICDPSDLSRCFRIAQPSYGLFELQYVQTPNQGWESIVIGRSTLKLRGCEASPRDIAFVKSPIDNINYDLLVADSGGGIIIFTFNNEWVYPDVNPPFGID